MVRKCFSIRDTVTVNNKPVTKFAKQLAGAISLLNTIRGGETVSLSDSQKEYTIKIRITSQTIFILIIYEAIILFAIFLAVRLVKHVYRLFNRLCNFNNLQMPDSYIKQNCCLITMLGKK